MELGTTYHYFKEDVKVLLASQALELSSTILQVNLLQLVGENTELEELAYKIPLKRSYKVHILAISNSHIVYLQEHEFNANENLNSITFSNGWNGLRVNKGNKSQLIWTKQ